MARPQKDSHPLTVRMEKELYNRLTDYCISSGESKTLTIERAVKQYIDDHNQTESK